MTNSTGVFRAHMRTTSSYEKKLKYHIESSFKINSPIFEERKLKTTFMYDDMVKCFIFIFPTIFMENICIKNSCKYLSYESSESFPVTLMASFTDKKRITQ